MKMKTLSRMILMAALCAAITVACAPADAKPLTIHITADKVVLRKVPVYDENNAMLLYTVVYYTDGTHEFVRAPGYTGPLPNW